MTHLTRRNAVHPRSLLRATLALLLTASAAAAQEPAPAPVPRPSPPQPPIEEVPEPVGTAQALRVFLDCRTACDQDYLRTETAWVSYMRDRMDAEVHVILTRITTGSGGGEYTMHLQGLQRLRGMEDTLRFAALPGEAWDRTRARIARHLRLGLVRYAIQTPQAAGLTVAYAAPPGVGGATTSAADDPWNSWVFRVGGGGSFNEEERRGDRRLNASASARRITADWKLGLSGNIDVRHDRFELTDRTTTSIRESYHAGAVLIRSLGPHWGAGVQTTVGSSSYNNQRLALRAAPALEYSLFPYSEATRRQLTIQYSLGVSSFDYREETIFGRLSEILLGQAFVIGYDVRQPWGSSDATVEWANYLSDFAKHRLRADGRVNLRLFRGLELNVGGYASLVRDQLFVPARDASEEDVLLQRRALLTNYRFGSNVGFSYTFGSIFSTVVNPRFGSGLGEILR